MGVKRKYMDEGTASETEPLIQPIPGPSTEFCPHPDDRGWRAALKADIRVPRLQTVAGILLGMLLLGMILTLIAETIRTYKKEDPFTIGSTGSSVAGTNFIQVPKDIFIEAWSQGEELVSDIKKLEKTLYDNGIVPAYGSPWAWLQQFLKSKLRAEELSKLSDCATVVEFMKKVLQQCIDVSQLPDHCIAKKPTLCSENYPYRYINGSCNNLNNLQWGMALHPFARLLSPEYTDGINLPRMSSTGEELPNARYLSNELYTKNTRPRCNCTMLTAYFGLFVDHDIVRIPIQTGHDGMEFSCCDEIVIDNPSLQHPACMPIRVPLNDSFYGPLHVTCLDFVRSAPVVGQCPGQREQVNLVTSFLDASGVYGSFEERTRDLRSHINGLLRVVWVNKTEVLPPAHHLSYKCGSPANQQYCFRAGDYRVNEQVELTVIHTIWMREHNRVATKLHKINPHWDDEKLFQEARRIVIAELQHITYHEFLSLLLGDQMIRKYRLLINRDFGYIGYRPDINPSIYNVFGAAAFRMGHSLIEGLLDLIGTGNKIEKKIPLHHVFLNPHLIYEDSIDLLIRGMVSEPSLSVDTFITDEVRNRLFQPPHGHYGMDLSAIGIQRGRDHGIPGYTKWRNFCELSEVSTWADLIPIMGQERMEKLRKVYKSVDDIDLTPASLSEDHLPGALVGPLHACLIARQFENIRFGDRFWFETVDQPWSFTFDQRKEIYNSSMARLFCDNSDELEFIQLWPFKVVSKSNPVVKCSELPEVNLQKWQKI